MTPTTTNTRAARRPTRVGSAIAVVAAATAVGVLASGSERWLALGVEVAGLSLLALGVALGRRGYRLAGIGVVTVASGVVLAALRFAVVLPATLPEQAVLVLGMLGTGFFALGVLPLRAGWSRRLVTTGAALVIIGALAAGALGETSDLRMFTAVAATLVAWDAGERAVGLGEQVGRDADTAVVELVRTASSTVVGAVAVGVAVGATSVEAVELPLAGVVLLLSTVIGLAIALYR